MNTFTVKAIVISFIAFVLVGVAMFFGPTMLSGFESMRTAGESSTETIAGVTTPDYDSLEQIDRSGVNNSLLTIARSGVSSSSPLVAVYGEEDMATVTVTYPVYFNQTGAVTSVTSNITETPSVAGVARRNISVGNLEPDDERDLTVNYRYAVPGEYTGLDTVVRFGPAILILGFIFVVGFVGFMGFRKKKEEE